MSEGYPHLPRSMSDEASDPSTPPPEPAQPPVNEVLGGAELATQQLIESQPTHVIWRAWGPEYVHPDGYSPELVEPLPVEFWDVPMKADLAAHTFSPDMEAVRVMKWAEVKAHRDWLEAGAAPTPIGPVQCDDRSKLKISGLVQLATIAAAAGAPFEEEFTLADNQVVTLTAQSAIGMGVAVGRYVSSVHAASRSLRARIHGAEASIAELLDLDVAAEFASALAPAEPD